MNQFLRCQVEAEVDGNRGWGDGGCGGMWMDMGNREWGIEVELSEELQSTVRATLSINRQGHQQRGKSGGNNQERRTEREEMRNQ